MKKLIGCLLCLIWIINFAVEPFILPKIRQFTLGYYNNSLAGARPVEKSAAAVDRGAILMYDQEFFRYGEHFSINGGLSYSYWQRKGEYLFDAAIYPQLRFWLYMDSRFSPYLLLSVGPSGMSTSNFAGDQLGSKFAFQDILGICTRVGGQKAVDFCGKFQHYSNAGLGMPNHGFDVPLLFSLGYNF